MHTLNTLRALAKRCGRGTQPDDVETYARADLLKLFQDRTELAAVFDVPESKIEAALNEIEADGKIDDLGFLTIRIIKARLDKAKEAKAEASIGLTEIAARAFLDAPSLKTLRDLCEAGDFSFAGNVFARKTIGAIVRQIKAAEVSIDRSKRFVIVVQAPKLRYRFIASRKKGPGLDLDTF